MSSEHDCVRMLERKEAWPRSICPASGTAATRTAIHSFCAFCTCETADMIVGSQAAAWAICKARSRHLPGPRTAGADQSERATAIPECAFSNGNVPYIHAQRAISGSRSGPPRPTRLLGCGGAARNFALWISSEGFGTSARAPARPPRACAAQPLPNHHWDPSEKTRTKALSNWGSAVTFNVFSPVPEVFTFL